MSGFLAVLRKEAKHMLRDKGTLRLALIIPVFQLVLFGLIDTNVRHVPTVVLDQSRTSESRLFLDELEATSLIRIQGYADSALALREEIVAGRASVGVEIPPDFARRRLNQEPATFQVLIDGSDSTVSSQVLAAVNGLAMSRSLEELVAQAGVTEPPFDARPVLLFNPDSRSATLLIPGLVAILLTFSGTLLSAFAIVRERERGTLEQLMVTPVAPGSIIFGKLVPYLVLACIQAAVVLLLMRFAFGVPIRGSLLLLAGLSLVYLMALLSLGLMISAAATTQMEATQLAQMILLPSILLSGYIFPLTSLPLVLRGIGYCLPATHFIAISRGIIVRGAALSDLWLHTAALVAIAAVLLTIGALRFNKTVS